MRAAQGHQGSLLCLVLAPAEDIEVPRGGEGLGDADGHDLDRDAAPGQPALEHQHVPDVAVGAEQLREDRDDREGGHAVAALNMDRASTKAV